MLADFLKDYLPIIVFLLVALVLSVAFVAVNYLASPKNPDPEKLSAYESVVSNHLMTLEWNLMLDFILLQYYLLFLI